MVSQEIVNKIVEEVLRRLEARRKRALVIFTGAALGFQEAIPQLKQLAKEGWTLKVLLSNSAEYVLTPKLIKEQLGISEVLLEKDVKSLHDLYKDVSTYIIPTLTLNTAAKISLGIQDTLVTNLIAHGIMSGLTIVAAKDGCDLSNPVRKEIGLNKNPKAYEDTFIQHLNNIESYGIKLVDAKGLYDSLNHKPLKDAVTTKVGTYEFNNKVLTRNHIFEARKYGEVFYVPKGTIITSLAMDAAREVGLKLKEK